MISTIHYATVKGNKGRKDRRTNMEIKKPYSAIQYSKFIKGVDRADQCLSYYSIEENCKMIEKGDNVSAELCTLQYTFFCLQKLNTNKNAK
jgi:hypothetical protein